MKDLLDVSFGPDVLQRLLPHRRPFLMVDRLLGYAGAPEPSAHASRLISANEPVFEGHFPGLHLWPGVYTIEGLGQTANLLQVLSELERGWNSRGGSIADVLSGLKQLEMGYRLVPGFRREAADAFGRALTAALPSGASRMGMSAAVDVKLIEPVFAGEQLDYFVRQVRELGNVVRFDVRAEVRGRVVAKGTMTSTRSVVVPGADPPSP